MVSIARKLVRRRGSLVAVVSSALLLAAIVAQQVLLNLLTTLSTFGLDSAQGDNVATIWTVALQFALGAVLPFVVGTFACLWLLAPIAPQLRLAHAITRSILAAGVGAAVVLVVVFVASLVSSWGFDGAIFANSFPTVTWSGSTPVDALVRSLQAAIAAFIGWLPHTVLVGLALWTWLDRHPVRHAVRGLIDEV